MWQNVYIGLLHLTALGVNKLAHEIFLAENAPERNRQECNIVCILLFGHACLVEGLKDGDLRTVGIGVDRRVAPRARCRKG